MCNYNAKQLAEFLVAGYVSKIDKSRIKVLILVIFRYYHLKNWMNLTWPQANLLQVGDKVDHRDCFGKVYKGSIIGKKDTLLRIHYDGYHSVWDEFSDYGKNLSKFYKVGSVSQKSQTTNQYARREWVSVNPKFRRDSGWRFGRVKKIDPGSGQVCIVYVGKQADELHHKLHYCWVHMDNDEEITKFGDKPDIWRNKETHELIEVLQEVMKSVGHIYGFDASASVLETCNWNLQIALKKQYYQEN